ncbi:MAG: hypothetical protein AAF602_21775, partial [Myxococcota bacterium]
MTCLFATLLFWFSAALAQPAPSVGGPLDDSIVLDLTEDGLAQLEPAVGAFVPSPIEPGTIQEELLGVITVTVSNLSIDVEVDDVEIVPRNSSLDLDVVATVSVNGQNTPAAANLDVGLFALNCNFYIQPFQVTGSTTAFLSLPIDPDGVDFDRDGAIDTRLLDVMFDAIEVTDNAQGSDVQTPGCALGPINSVLSAVGINAFDALLDAVRPQLLAAVEDLPAQLEPLLEEPFSSFVVAEEVNLLGVPVFVALWPEALRLDSNGLRVGLASFVDAPADPCVERYGIDRFSASFEDLPEPPHPSSPFSGPDVAAFVEDDFANQVLWAAWSGGLLCLDLDDPPDTFVLPLEIDSSLVVALGPEGTYDALFEETVPVSLVTDPKAPPVVDLSGETDETVLIDPVGLVIEAEVAGRRARVLDIEVTGRLGADLDFDGQTGAIDIGLTEIGPDSVDVVVAHNDFAPDANDEVAANVKTLLTDIAGPLLDDQLEGVSLALDLPSFDGFGLQSLETAPSAADGSILGAYAEVGPVPYTSASCTDGG